MDGHRSGGQAASRAAKPAGPWRPARVQDTRGAAALDHVGAIVIVAVVISGIIGAVAVEQPAVAAGVKNAICALLQLGICAPPEAAPLDNADYVPPPCITTETGQQAGVEVKIAFIKIGQNWGFIREQYADGTVKLTVTDSATLGAQTGVGADLTLGKINARAKIDIGGGLSFGYGDTWSFDSIAQEQKMRRQLDDYLAQQEALEHDTGGGYALWLWLSGGYVDPPKPPAETFSTLTVDASAKPGLGLQTPIGTNTEGKTQYKDNQIGIAASLDGSYEVVVKKDTEAHTTSYTYTVTGTAAASVNVVLASKGGELSTTGSVTLTRDAKGTLVAVSLVSTRAGGGDATLGGAGEQKTSGKDPEKSAGGSIGVGTGTQRAITTTVNLDLTSPADRAVVQAWLNGNNEQLGAPLALTANTMVPDHLIAGDPFQNLLFQKAKVSQVAYNEVKDVFDFGLEVKLGLELGLAVHTENSTKTVQDPKYLSAPQPDGSRSFLEDPTC